MIHLFSTIFPSSSSITSLLENYGYPFSGINDDFYKQNISRQRSRYKKKNNSTKMCNKDISILQIVHSLTITSLTTSKADLKKINKVIGCRIILIKTNFNSMLPESIF